MNESPLLSCDARQLGRSLRLWRSLRRMKQGAVAAEMRVSQTTVSRWESGLAAPSPEEQQALPLLARAAALRFLLTRAHDWVHTAKNALVKRKDPLEYLRRLKFHRTIVSASEYGLTPQA